MILTQKFSPAINGIINLVNLFKIYREKSGDSYKECLKNNDDDMKNSNASLSLCNAKPPLKKNKSFKSIPIIS